MSDIERLLAEKEAALHRVKREIEALRLSAALLAEPADEILTPEPATVPVQAPEPVAAPVLTAVPPRSKNAARRTDTDIRHFVAANPRPRVASPEIFPPARDGFIVCDGCGHRNPEFLLDCEQCDLPIRLRP